MVRHSATNHQLLKVQIQNKRIKCATPDAARYWKQEIEEGILYEDAGLFDEAAAAQYDGGGSSSGFSIVGSSFSGWMPGP